MTQKIFKPKNSTKGKYGSAVGLVQKLMNVAGLSQVGKFPDFKPGDTVKVHVRIKEGDKERIQIYEGVCIKRKSNLQGIGSFTVRKMSHGTGVERVFQENSPKVAKVERVQSGRVRRAKLYYLRNLEGKAAKIDRKLEKKTAKSAKA